MALKTWRKRNNISQAELARRLATSKAYISQLETGHRRPSTDLAKRIEQATNGGVTAIELRGLAHPDYNVSEDPTSFDYDLRSKAEALGLDPDAIAKKAVEEAVKRKRIETWIDDNREAMEANAKDIRENGLWSDELRAF